MTLTAGSGASGQGGNVFITAGTMAGTTRHPAFHRDVPMPHSGWAPGMSAALHAYESPTSVRLMIFENKEPEFETGCGIHCRGDHVIAQVDPASRQIRWIGGSPLSGIPDDVVSEADTLCYHVIDRVYQEIKNRNISDFVLGVWIRNAFMKIRNDPFWQEFVTDLKNYHEVSCVMET